MDLSGLSQILANQPAYRLKQIKKDLYVRLIESWDQATSLPKDLREALEKECPLAINAETFVSKDQRIIKALTTLKDGLEIETVLMRQKNRQTVCVSTQVGCPLGCAFCATGQMGFKRNLTAEEMVEQVIFFDRLLKKSTIRVNHVVFMGMGEPFLNFENLIEAIKIFNEPEGLNIGERKISVSTVGIPEKIRQFADLKLQVNLAISLHAPDDDLRSKTIPINQKYPIAAVMAAVDDYLARTRRKVMFEYLMIKGVNDQPEMADKLARLLRNRLCMVNLIAYNPTGNFHPSDREQILKFRQILEKQGIEVTQRFSFGRDIKAACGQLTTAKHLAESRRLSL